MALSRTTHGSSFHSRSSSLLIALAAAAAGTSLAHCSSSTPPPAGQITPVDGGSEGGPTGDASGDAPSGGVVITPAPAKALTCDTVQFAESGGPSGGVWGVSPAAGGSISATGLYLAPASAATTSASVRYAGASGETPLATADVTIATAFPGTQAAVPIAGNGNAVPDKPFEKTFSSSSNTVLAAVDDASNTGVDFFVSTNSGATFSGPTTYHTGNLACETAVLDPGDPNVVYLAYLAGHGDSTSNTGATLRLAVSTDGAKTFPTEYVIVDSDNSLASFICPDIVAPSPDHVIVSAVSGGAGNPAWLSTFTSSQRGAGIGPLSTAGAFTDAGPLPYTAGSDTNTAATSSCDIYDDGSAGSPRIASNATGTACIVYQHIDDVACGALSDAVMVQCSTDNGAHWTAPFTVDSNTVQNTIPTVAVSPGGNVAIVYTKEVAEDAGTNNESFLAITKNGGTTWSAPVMYPTALWLAAGGGASGDVEGLSFQSLHWESDDILWLGATLVAGNAAHVYVDKTCDFGATWSGPVTAGEYATEGIFATGAGIAMGTWISDNSSGGPALSLLPLSP